jgi:hypothetical protein
MTGSYHSMIRFGHQSQDVLVMDALFCCNVMSYFCWFKKEVFNVLDSFLSFLKKYDNKKAHNMISLIVDPS